MTRSRFWLSMLVLVPLPALAQLEWGQEYASRVRARETLTALGPDLFGEQVNLFDGTASFSVADLSVPGNSALAVGVTRRLQIGNVGNAAQEAPFGDWELAIPYLSNVSTTSTGWQVPPDPNSFWIVGGANRFARCSGPQSPGDANTVDIPNTLANAPGGGELFLITSATSPKLVRPTVPGVRWLTKGFWYLGCTPSLASGHPGEGFWAIDPSGTKYTFDWMVRHAYPGFSTPAMQNGGQLIHNRSELRLYPTRVEDRFGNWVTYAWQGRRLLRIVANDGRRIDFGYGSDDQIISATAHGKTWTYTYRDHASPGVGGQLLSVTNPDGSSWSYGNNPGPFVQYAPRYEIRTTTTRGGMPATEEVEVYEKVTFCSYDHYLSPNVVPFVITHPSGARGEFRFRTMRHGRTNVPGACQFSWDTNDAAPRESQNSHNLYPAFKDVWSLVGKSIEGPGLGRLDWVYTYDDLQACITTTCAQSGAPTRKRVTITQPNGDTLTNVFGKGHGLDEGVLLSTETRRGPVLASRVDFTHVSAAEAESLPFPALVGVSATEFSDPFSSAALRPLKSSTRLEDGTTYVTAVNVFDAFARPVNVARSNSTGAGKTDVIEYLVDLSRWVTTLVRRQSNAETGVVVSETEYDDRLLPLREYQYGKLKRSLTSWPDGTVRTTTDALGNVTSLSDYHRGIPRVLATPPTAEAPAGSNRYVSVSELGWVTSITDETGAKTCYDYDAMGRLAKVTHPSVTQPGSCDTSRWEQSLTVFEQRPVAERGLEAGHWRRTRSEGRQRRVTYFDALWRPVFEEAWDDDELAATQQQIARAYDFEGRQTFQSYPLRGLNALTQATTGVRTSYDALGRQVRLEQDSELGVLSQTTEYLPGVRTRVTNPRGFQTVTAFLAWDAFQQEHPLRLEQPEGKVVEFVRHPRFGWPLSLTQQDAAGTLRHTRGYVYDGSTLCKIVEPESGATVFGFDAADNPVWTARGLVGGGFESTSGCSTTEALASGRVVHREFDARNRLTRVRFPDGRGDEVRTWEPDGLLSSVTTFNEPNSAPVITSFTYDARRLVTSETIRQPGWYAWTLTSEFDRLGHLRLLQYPSGLTLDLAPNAFGQPTQLRDQFNHTYVSAARYHPNGTLSGFVYGNGVAYSMAQNARQLPAEVRSGTVMASRFDFDAARNVVRITDVTTPGASPRTRSMTFDGLDRLTSATAQMFGGLDGRHLFGFDALDNLRSWRLDGVKNVTNVYDARNRLVMALNANGPSTQLAYDAQGNTTMKGQDAYDFDFGNRLRAVVGKEGYRYDGFGRRALSWQSATGAVTLYQYDRDGLLRFEHDGSSTVERLSLSGSLVAERRTTLVSGAVSVRYQHTDALGSPVVVTNEAGAVVDRNDFEPYGSVIGEPSFGGSGFAGHLADRDTGLTYMQQRYYDPGLGRFLSVDPVEALTRAEPEGLFQAPTLNFNRYWYANANPYRFVDPDGRQSAEVRGNVDLLITVSDPSVTREERTELLNQLESATRGESRVGMLIKYGVTLWTRSENGKTTSIRVTNGDFAKLNRLATDLAKKNPKLAARLKQIIEKGVREKRVIVKDRNSK